jgi:hypothetical protein
MGWLPTKDQSETIRNVAGAIAIIVGGGWVLYKWNTMFPKTEAEVLTASASVRTDVTGDMSVHLGGLASDGYIIDDQTSQAQESCAALPAGSPGFVPVPVSARINISSASQIPVRIQIREMELVWTTLEQRHVVTGAPREPFEPLHLQSASTELADGDFVGALSWSRVEMGGSVSLAIAKTFNLPLTCVPDDNDWVPPGWISISVSSDIIGVDPRSGTDIEGAHVKKVFTAACSYLGFDPRYDCSGEPLVAQ